ncbi:MAG: radical SAM protein [Phocaeicola sp.]
MDKIKRVILLAVPMSICNFRCSYCYLTHREEYYQNKQPNFKYSPEHVGKALSKERLEGLAFINICADGETLLTKDIDKYTYELLKNGHYIEFVTNLTVTKVLDKMLLWEKELLERLEFKCSFHYLQLKEKNLLDTFAANIHRIWEAGASANIEITPSDDLIPYVEEVKEFSMKHFGALPHLSIARNDDSKNTEYLTDLSIEEYDKVWSSFDSEFWKFKKEIFLQKRNEFCYAGDWLLQIDLASGLTNQCYKSISKTNVFESINQPIKFRAIGKCLEPHCYNGHAMLTLGCIPNLTTVKYGDIRNRRKEDGTEWLQPKVKEFFNSTLVESNKEYSDAMKAKKLRDNYFLRFSNLIKRAKRRVIK